MIRVLYVEDDAPQARLAQRQLEKSGISVVVAIDAKKGAAALVEQPVDVLVVDKGMPGTSGIDFIRRLSAEERLPPSIVVTAGGDAEAAVESLEAGADNFLLKDDRGAWIVLLEAMIRQLSERSRQQRLRRLDEARLETLLSLHQMVDAPFHEVTDFAMEAAVRLTGSNLGYLAFLNDDETELTMHSWSKVAMAECRIRDKQIVYRVDQTGLWGEAVRQRRPIITNDYAAPSPHKRGCPQGHVAIVRHANVPIFDGERIVVVIGVGNKPDDYDESDIRQLTLLMQGMWQQIKQQRLRGELDAAWQHLEDMVDDRTRQLAAANEELTEVNHRMATANASLEEEVQERMRAKQAAEDGNELLRAVLETSVDGILATDGEGRVLVSNATFATMWRIPSELLAMGNEDALLAHACGQLGDPDAFLAGVRDVVAQAASRFDTLEFKDGRVFERYASPLMSEGRPVGQLWCFRDITNQRAAEESLRRRTDELDNRVRELHCLFSISKLLEDEPPLEEALTKSVELILPAMQYPDIACARLLFEGRVYASSHFEDTLWKIGSPVQVNGAYVGWAEVCYLEERPAADEGPFLREEQDLVAAVADRLGKYVERTRGAAEIRTLKRQIEFVLGATNTGMVILEENLSIRYVDPAWEARLGSVAGRKCHEYLIGSDQPCRLCGVRQAFATNKPCLVEQTLPRDGNRLVQCTTIPFEGERGERLAAQVYVDITERRQLERELSHAQKLEAIGQLAAGIAHEINTPTQYIGDNIRFLDTAFQDVDRVIASMERLLQAAAQNGLDERQVAEARDAFARADLAFLAEEVPKAIRHSLEGVDQVSSIVRAMKEFAHPGQENKTPTDLNRLIETTATVCRNEWKYVAELRTDLDPQLPRVLCLPRDLQQAILNLIVNAAQAIDEANVSQNRAKGTITIATRREGNVAEIRVSDDGVGIPAEIRSRVFDPFFTTKPVGRGTGQGLSLVHATVAKQHGGAVTFESQPGRGTTFVVRLPLGSADEPLLARSTGELQ